MKILQYTFIFHRSTLRRPMENERKSFGFHKILRIPRLIIQKQTRKNRIQIQI